MAQPLKIKLHSNVEQSLPLVLAGPILRKVDYHSVTVWVALHKASQVNLVISELQGNSLVPISFSNAAPANTYQIGKHVHLACVSVKDSGPSAKLHPGKIYFYNLEIDTEGLEKPNVCFCDMNSSALFKKNFSFDNVVGLPSFVLPPDNVSELRLAHASCRLPHGPGQDALKFLDLEIGKFYNDPTKRPHLLCLTGDQIYADDVDKSFLGIISNVAEKLIDFVPEEVVNNNQENARTKGWLKPGARKDMIEESGLSTEKAENHLVTLSEFYAMYLLVWSQVLWRPSLQSLTTTYSSELRGFHASLLRIRKVLANIPTYMVADDHEVTDDWFIGKAWCEDVFSKKIGKQIIRNGMIAHTLFQAWGNEGDYVSGLNILDSNNIIRSPQNILPFNGPNAVNLISIGNEVCPSIVQQNYNGIEWYTLKPGNSALIQWSREFSLSFNNFQIIFLDTRNQRGFMKESDPVALIHPDRIAAQLGNDYSKDLTIVVSAAPVFGSSGAEWGQHLLSFYKYKYDVEAWKFNQHSFDILIQKLAEFKKVVLLSGDVHYGFTRLIKCKNTNNANIKATIIQCCASAIKNKKSLLMENLRYDYNTYQVKTGSWEFEIKPIIELSDRKIRVNASLDLLQKAAQAHRQILLRLPSNDDEAVNASSGQQEVFPIKYEVAVIWNNFGLIDFINNSVLRHRLVCDEAGDPLKLQYVQHLVPLD